MKPEELLFRLEQASSNILLRMEWQQLAVQEKLSGAVERVGSSPLAERLRDGIQLFRQILLRVLSSLKERSANSETIKFLKDIAKANLRLLASRISFLSPYVYEALQNRLMIAYVSLLAGVLAGRVWMSGYPELQAQQMVSVVCGGYSGPESVAVCRIPVPRVTSNQQVLVRVMSAGLDRTDLMAVSGWARLERRKPHGGFTLGRDFCGIVVEAGVGVSHVHPGDRVWGLLPYHVTGSLSEQLVVSGDLLARMPSNLNWEGGATVPYSALQVWEALVWTGGLVPDQAAGVRVLITDGVTDTGCLAIQLACLWGAHVTVVCSPRAVQLAHALGAHMVLGLENSESLADLSEAGPFCLIVRCGLSLPVSSLSPLLLPKGRVTSALPPSSISSDSWGPLRRLLLPAWRTLLAPPHTVRQSKVGEPLQYVTQAVQKGKLQPVLDTVLAPTEVSGALTRLAAQDSVGKSVVLFDRL